MNHASLFSGIGGFDLAAREVGWNNVFQCEIDPFCQSVLKYYFPKTVLYEDIKRTDFTSWKGKIDVLTGGFPCQPFSVAGQRKGADDNRYLWPEMLRVIRETRPLWVIGENVAGITNMVQPGSETDVETKSDQDEENYYEHIGYDGGSKDMINRKRLIGNTYQIYRSILHQLAIDEDWNNVYSDIMLPSGDMGTIKVERIDDDKDNDI